MMRYLDKVYCVIYATFEGLNWAHIKGDL